MCCFARSAFRCPAFRIAGGLLLFAIAFEMVLGVRMRREGQAAEEAVEEHVRNIAAFPLAIPLMAGPGAITATVLLAGRAYGQMLLVGLLLAVVVFVALACLAAFLLAGRISRMLGHTGNIVLSRLLGVLLAALAVQYVVDGIRAVGRMKMQRGAGGAKPIAASKAGEVCHRSQLTSPSGRLIRRRRPRGRRS